MAKYKLPPKAFQLIARAFTRELIVSELEHAKLDVPKGDREVIAVWVKHLAHVFDPTDNPYSLDSLLMGLTAGGIGFLQDNGLLSDALKRALLLNVAVLENLYRASNGKIENASHSQQKENSNRIRFDVTVPSEGETVIRYTAHYFW